MADFKAWSHSVRKVTCVDNSNQQRKNVTVFNLQSQAYDFGLFLYAPLRLGRKSAQDATTASSLAFLQLAARLYISCEDNAVFQTVI